MSKYPEHDRMAKVSSESQAIGQFLEWLRSSETPYIITELEKWWPCDAESWDTIGGEPKWKCNSGRMMSGEEHDPWYWGQCEECGGTGRVEAEDPRLFPASIRTVDLLALYFDIDLDKINDEKDAMLKEIRERDNG